MESEAISAWNSASAAQKVKTLQNLFSTEGFQPLEITQLVQLAAYMALEGYAIPNTTQDMLGVLNCLADAGAIELQENEDQILLVRST